MKKFKYTCTDPKCQEVNIVTVDEVIRMGMGRSGISATEIGGIDIMADSTLGSLGGFAGFGSDRQYPPDVIHHCKKCNKKHILTL